MKAGGGKAKGSSYEREIAKKLSLWLTAGKRNDCIWRTSNSGGQATVTKFDTQCGDLHAVRPEAQKFFDTFSLELKNYKALDILTFQSKNFILKKWWVQASTDAKRANKIPLLIVRINRRGDWLIFSESVRNILIEDYLDINKTMKYSSDGLNIISDLGNLWMKPLDFLFECFYKDKFN